MESDEEKRTPRSSTSPQCLLVHVVYAVAFVAAGIWFQCQLVELKRDNELLKVKIDFLTLQKSATNGKDRRNVAEEITDTRERQLVYSGSEPISLSIDRSREKRSTSKIGSRPARNRTHDRVFVAAHFVLDSERLKAAKENERSGGQPVNYTGANLKWNVTDLSSPRRNHIDADGTTVTIAEDGVYFVYAQAYHAYYCGNGTMCAGSNRLHTPGPNIRLNSRGNLAATKSVFRVDTKNETLLKCFQSVDTVSDAATGSESHRIKTCYTAGLFALRQGEKLQLVNGSSRAIHLDKHANYWGLVKFHDWNHSS